MKIEYFFCYFYLTFFFYKNEQPKVKKIMEKNVMEKKSAFLLNISNQNFPCFFLSSQQKDKKKSFHVMSFKSCCFCFYGAGAAVTPAPAFGPLRLPPGPMTTLTKRRLYWRRLLARPVFGFFLPSCLATYLYLNI